MKKPILLIDFDGVLHSYLSGWKGARIIPDLPVPGAIEFLIDAVKSFDVQIYSSRSRQWGGKKAMKKWLFKYLSERYINLNMNYFVVLPYMFELAIKSRVREVMRPLKFPTKKPAAFLTIDDRAFCFRGDFPDPQELLLFERGIVN